MVSPFSLSFEFFPPKTEAMERQLWEAVELLTPFAPEFVSVTYGAGGTTRERTHAIVAQMARETSLKPAAHLTCVDASRDEVDGVIRSYADVGVRHIVALRGDPSGGVGAPYVPHPTGYENAADLVRGIKALGDFEISVSAYPEKHPASASFDEDLQHLRAKWEHGARRAITQFFFDCNHYARYLERVQKAGIGLEVVPGLIPVHNITQVASFAKRCGTHVPDAVFQRFEGLEGVALQAETTAFALEQVRDLRAMGVEHLHFYTLNRGQMIANICNALI